MKIYTQEMTAALRNRTPRPPAPFWVVGFSFGQKRFAEIFWKAGEAKDFSFAVKQAGGTVHAIERQEDYA